MISHSSPAQTPLLHPSDGSTEGGHANRGTLAGEAGPSQRDGGSRGQGKQQGAVPGGAKGAIRLHRSYAVPEAGGRQVGYGDRGNK
jgi:hypothetical protein